jgi:hypothetical protein
MSRRLLTIATIALIVGLVLIFVATPYVRAASLVVRAANLGGRAEAYADEYARPVTIEPTHMVPTRYGIVPAKFYMPDGETSRSVLLIPGIHSMGIEEPRLTALAKDLAGTGVIVMTMALPDLQAYMITPRATDVIEDAGVRGWRSGPTSHLTARSASSASASREACRSRRPAVRRYAIGSRSSSPSAGMAICRASCAIWPQARLRRSQVWRRIRRTTTVSR